MLFMLLGSYIRGSKSKHQYDCQLFFQLHPHTHYHGNRQNENHQIGDDISELLHRQRNKWSNQEIILETIHLITYQESQKHRHCLDAVVVVVGFDKDGDRVTGKEVRYREADGPAHYICQYSVYYELEFSDSKNVLVHDQDRRLDKAEAYYRYHVERELGLFEYD